jgi:FtsP/CotA-like multicopper oxidase with cupredoxin domain
MYGGPMKNVQESRREFLKLAGLTAGACMLPASYGFATGGLTGNAQTPPNELGKADYTLRIGATPVEVAPGRILSSTTYNGQFPGPLLRFKEGQQVTIDIYNDTSTPEQLHWHGQAVSTDVDGASERRHSIRPCARKAPNYVYSPAMGSPLLSHA